ncbi:MAG: retroviral-like aspartic protease, partial [Mycoplasma sp.]|nr:retroviral-like aspartic protease [Mycoplasma sp.]
MAGAIHLPADRTSAGINSLKNDSRIFCNVQIRPLDLPQRRETSLRFLVDSGAEVSALSVQDYFNLVKKLMKLSPTKIQLYNFDNSKLKKPKGQVNLRISVGGEWINGNFQVLSSSCQSVLGALELKALKLLIDMGTGTLTPSTLIPNRPSGSKEEIALQITSKSEPLLFPPVERHAIQCTQCILEDGPSTVSDPELDILTKKFPKLFSEGVGIFNGEEHKIHVKP